MISRVSPIPLAYGLEDLIAGVAPTFDGWDTDPTDGANITDGDPATACTTGTSNQAAFSPLYVIWDLPAVYNILVTGLGRIIASAGTPRWYVNLYAAGSWRAPSELAGYGTSDAPLVAFGGMAEKVRLRFLSTDIATLTPYIRDVSVWRLQ